MFCVKLLSRSCFQTSGWHKQPVVCFVVGPGPSHTPPVLSKRGFTVSSLSTLLLLLTPTKRNLRCGRWWMVFRCCSLSLFVSPLPHDQNSALPVHHKGTKWTQAASSEPLYPSRSLRLQIFLAGKPEHLMPSVTKKRSFAVNMYLAFKPWLQQSWRWQLQQCSNLLLWRDSPWPHCFHTISPAAQAFRLKHLVSFRKLGAIDYLMTQSSHDCVRR